ncbi:hypothetical protein DVA86_17310 [Streptomyces armeniacus]|uniref:Uncharacterized protein n=1 Tax=Streptomyces armeniacus TaxID=83291 RepID=A0A345Y0J6_9ACTN|nr:hypothetical protein [Streptomyces armeniacus]AXK37412.1 hypothetical protein DVA86_17310 [Streptomyces armeniacus]
MTLVLFVLFGALFGLGFLNPLWWVTAALLAFVLVRSVRGGRGRGRPSDYGEYRARRDRESRWERRYRRQRRGRWMRQERHDHYQHG